MVEVQIDVINGRQIVLKGVGKAFYQNGFPISIAILKAKELGAEVSLLHVADECLKHGWSETTVIRKLKEEFADDPERNQYDIGLLERFVWASYEDQREMIFQYLFGCSTNDVRSGENTYPLKWLSGKV
jgi:hypothetical protein